MGPSSAFAGAFGGPSPSPARSGTPGIPTPPQGPAQTGFPISPVGGNGGLPLPGPAQSGTPPVPTPSQGPAQNGNVLGPTAVRASGDPKGFDPSYLQNLATAIGGLFSNPKGGSTMNINPLGNLSEISPPSGQLGNAPGFGEPLTWLQQALNGLGFSFGPPPPAATSITPTVPNVGSVGVGAGRGAGNRLALNAL